MDLIDILTNPLFVPLLVALITISFNAYFLYWLRKWQYRAEYINRNVEKTYIPLVAEINDRLEYFNRFLEDPNSLKWSFETLERIKKSGLFEFIKSHDKKLYEKLNLFYNDIYPKFGELDELQRETRDAISLDWIRYIEDIIEDKDVKKYANNFVFQLFNKGLYVLLLNGRTEEISKIWNETLYYITQTYQLYSPYVVSKGRIKVFPKGKFPTFNVSQDEIEKLMELSSPKLQNLLNFYRQIKSLLDDEVVNCLVPMMQKYITNPLS